MFIQPQVYSVRERRRSDSPGLAADALYALGPFGPVVAFDIATAKATIVVLDFMHLTEASFSVQMVALMNFLFVTLICLGVLADVALR